MARTSIRAMTFWLISSAAIVPPIAGNAEQFAEVPLVIGGTQIAGDSSYSYLGAIRPAWGGELGRGWYQSGFLSYLTYEYDTQRNNTGLTIKAKAPGAELGIGYVWTQADWNLNLSLAGGYRYFDLSPNLRSEGPRGGEWILTPQLQANAKISPYLDVDLLSNVSLGPDSTFNRLRGGYFPKGDWRIGPEFVYQEGENYRNTQIGLFLSMPVSDNIKLDLSAGNSRQEDGSHSAYVGVAFSLVRWK